MRLKLVIFFFLLNCVASFAQYKQMLHKPYKDKVNDIGILYGNAIDKQVKDSLFIKKYTDEMQDWALSNNDKELALEAELLKAYVNWFIYGDKRLELVQNLIDVAKKGNKNYVYHIEERAIQVIAKHYWAFKDYENAFEWLLQSAKILEKIDPDSFPNMAMHLNFIGRSYYNFEDYNSSLIYYKKAANLKKTAFNATDIIEAQNTVGLCYQKLGKLELAQEIFLKVIQDTSIYKSITWQNIASGNLGYNYYLKEEYDKAIPLFEKDIENAKKIKEYRLVPGSAIPLAAIYLKQNKLLAAKQKIDEAKEYIQKSKETDCLKDLYPVMSKWYAAKNKIELSAAYLDSTMIAVTNYNKKYSALKLSRANQKVEAKERKHEVENLKSKNQLKLTERNFIILIIAILLTATILAFWFRNKYLLKKQQIKELALQNTKRALDNAKSKLKNLTTKIRQDSDLITELKKDKTSTNITLLSKLKSKNILTQRDWNEFQGLFKEVYPYYIMSITSKYPDLSEAEIRCLCLEKLQLTNTEMGLVLGVSTNTIRVTKHRIRKKLSLESQDELDHILKKIDN